MNGRDLFLPDLPVSRMESTHHVVYVIQECILGRWVSSTTYRANEQSRARARLDLIRACHPTTGFRLVETTTTITTEVIVP
jgi:hypothetical protein